MTTNQLPGPYRRASLNLKNADLPSRGRHGAMVAAIGMAMSLGVVPRAGAVTYYATYKLNGGTLTLSNQTYTASDTDTSGVWVASSGFLTLSNSTITTSGGTSSQDNSSFYGLNAGLPATAAGSATVSGGTITTHGAGANGAFATGSGSAVTLSNVRITAGADGAHGVMATQAGAVTLTNVDITTAGQVPRRSPPIGEGARSRPRPAKTHPESTRPERSPFPAPRFLRPAPRLP